MPERLDPEVMAMVAAREFFDGAVVNLGMGLPLGCADWVPPGREVLFHSEQGLIGFGPRARERSEVNVHVMTASGQPVVQRPGMVFMSHDESFALVRGGHLDFTVLGALQVDIEGNLANTHVPGKVIGSLGGAQDLAMCAQRLIVVMTHTAKDGSAKVVDRCTMPLTAPRCVDRIVTDVAVMDVEDGSIVLRECAPGWDPERIQAITGTQLVVDPQVREITLA
jgi:3-oxoacid CoA-transferase B subunit